MILKLFCLLLNLQACADGCQLQILCLLETQLSRIWDMKIGRVIPLFQGQEKTEEDSDTFYV